MEYEIEHKKKATEITPDGIAAAAATLAVKSEEGEDLFEAFWYFFDALLADQHQVKRELGSKLTREEKLREGERLWDGAKWTVSGIKPRAYNSLARAYRWGDLLKPITELTDDDLLKVRGIGLKALVEIRTKIPAPASLPEGERDEK